jgi:alanine racemase
MTEAAPSRITVDLAAYARNLDVIRSRIPSECAVLAVVKSNAYGLGAVPMARRALEEGVAMLGVAHIHEGIELRDAGIDAPILVLVQPSLSDLILAIRYKLRVMVSDYGTAERLGDLARKNKYVAPIHCEVDTGMGRQGFGTEDIARELLKLSHISNVDIEGIATHFASADEPSDPYTEQQYRTFQKILKQASRDGIPFEMAHAANSAAVMNHPATACDMVRVGISTYGVWPNNVVPESGKLHHVVRWTSSLVLVKQMPGGASVSYGRTWRASSPTRIGIVPVGYADGYRRSLSNNSDVLIRGKRCPVRGTVTMNELMVDLNGVPEANTGDRATLIGEDHGERITVEELAEKAGTIGYEILTGLGNSIPRDYVN